MKKKHILKLIPKVLLFTLIAWILYVILFATFAFISDITGLNPGIILIGTIIWIISLIITGTKFLKKENEICEQYQITKLNLAIVTLLTIIIANVIFLIVIFQLGNYNKLPFIIHSDYEFLLYNFMAILFIIETILVLGIGYLVKYIKRNTI